MTGLSLATISKYFNGGNVREANRASIESAADALGYRVNAFASNLRRGRSRSVGVLLPSLKNDFHLCIISGVEGALRDDGISVVVSSIEAEAEAPGDAVDHLLDKMVDGIITVPDPRIVQNLIRAIDRGVPVVCVDWQVPEVAADSVSLDNKGAGAKAAIHLLNHGHTKIGLVGGDPSVSTMRDRTAGFASALKPSHPLNDDFLLQVPLTVEDGHRAMGRLLTSRDRPTAVFSANYELTLGSIIAINESGLRLGTDISLLGFDGAELARATRPQLTTILQPVQAIAIEAAMFMRERLASEEPTALPARQLVLEGALVAGGSVASLHE